MSHLLRCRHWNLKIIDHFALQTTCNDVNSAPLYIHDAEMVNTLRNVSGLKQFRLDVVEWRPSTAGNNVRNAVPVGPVIKMIVTLENQPDFSFSK